MGDNYINMEDYSRLRINEMQEEAKQAALADEANENKFSLRKFVGQTLISAGEKISGENQPQNKSYGF
jgi:hypothetical protein